MATLETLAHSLLVISSLFNAENHETDRAIAFYQFCAPIVEPDAHPKRQAATKIKLITDISFTNRDLLSKLPSLPTNEEIIEANDFIEANCMHSPIREELIPGNI